MEDEGMLHESVADVVDLGAFALLAVLVLMWARTYVRFLANWTRLQVDVERILRILDKTSYDANRDRTMRED